MDIPRRNRKRIARFLLLSATLHLAISAFVIVVVKQSKVRVVNTPARLYVARLAFAGGAKVEWTPAPVGRRRHPVSAQKPASDLAVQKQPAPSAGRPVAANESAAAGNGADRQNANPAFPVFSPRPPVGDRSLLPSENREVVVDVRVSADGNVLEATLVRGIGNALDRIVLETVRTWRFHPASVSGTPIVSEAELIFPFNLNYPITAG